MRECHPILENMNLHPLLTVVQRANQVMNTTKTLPLYRKDGI